MADVRQKDGVPVAGDFASTSGTPIVVDSTSGIAYLLDGAGIVTQLGGTGGGMTYPGAGIGLSTGAAWAASIANSSTVGQVLRVTGTSTYGFGAVNLADTDAVTGLLPSSNVEFLQAGTAAVARTVQAKERDIVSVNDFGAVGDGTTDDTNYFVAATAVGVPVYVPYTSNFYKLTTLSSSSALLLYGPGLIKVNGVTFSINTASTKMLYSYKGAYINNIFPQPSWNFYGLIDYMGHQERTGIYETVPDAVSATITLADGAALPLYCPTNNCMYVVNTTANSVSVVNTANNTVVTTISTGVSTAPSGIAYCPTNNCMYVLNYTGDSISVIDCATNTIIQTITSGNGPQVIAYCPTNNCMYVAMYFDNTVSVIETTNNTITKTFSVGAAPSGICYVPINNNLYVTNQTDGTISVISPVSNTVTSTITLTADPVTFTPGAMQFCPTNNCLYAVNYATNNVYVVNLISAAQAVITVGTNPYDVQFCPTNNYIYVANQSTDNVSIIDAGTNTVFKTVTVGTGPSGIGWSPTNNVMYVANFGSDNMSALQCGMQITCDRLTSFGHANLKKSGNFLTSNGASTSNQYLNIVNTGGNFYFGVESSAGGSLITGSAAYSAIFATVGATWLHLGTNGVKQLSIDPSGNVLAPSIWANAGGTTAVLVDANGQLWKQSSSLKYKDVLEPYNKGLSDVMKLNPIYYTIKSDENKNIQAGFIAEEFDSIGLKEFVSYAPDKTPDGIDYGRTIALLVNAIKELKSEFDSYRSTQMSKLVTKNGDRK